MKSLIFNGSGCTVYNSKGRIAYRVDNYNHKEGDLVYLMNHRGEILFEIIKKKLRVFGRWEGYCCSGSKRDEMLPWFRVRRPFRSAFKDGSSSCELWNSSRRHLMMRYKIEEMTQEASYKITEISGEIVAEVKRKQTESGVVLGDDVLTLVVEPNMDHSFIIGLVVVHGLMYNKI
ncbi:Protein LURP-one-related 11 [Apostasia shenzhenica]|uniref:Protein LURP-one-related 11 n=1 Tax=Apostasia shenzhenica TaxID=1088818 RepID=A0A2I0A617_9ASPA|nr:Protein LURP-one-related 11 [Apostasia shenzhenica]